MEGHRVLPAVFEAIRQGYRELRQWTPHGIGHKTPAGWKIQPWGHGRDPTVMLRQAPPPCHAPPLRSPQALEDSSRELEELRHGSD